MKRLTTVLIGVLLSISSAFAQSKGLMIFLDHSSSMVSTADFSDTETRVIRKLLTEHFSRNGDFVIVSYLFSNTSSISNRTEYVFRFRPTPTKGLSDKQAEIKRASDKGRKRRYKSALIQRIIKEMSVSAPKANRSEILESLVQVNRVQAKASQLEIVYLSDMEETSEYRVFGEINSVTKAIECAKEDLQEVITDYHLPSTIATPTRVKCYFPSNTLDNCVSLRFIEAYWREIFQSFFKRSTVQFLNL